MENAIGKGLKKLIVCAPASAKTLFANNGAVLPASVAVPPISPPVASVRYVFFFVILPFDADATDAINGINIAINAEFVINIENTADSKKITTTNCFSLFPINLDSKPPNFPATPDSNRASIMITMPITSSTAVLAKPENASVGVKRPV